MSIHQIGYQRYFDDDDADDQEAKDASAKGSERRYHVSIDDDSTTGMYAM